MLVLHSHMRGFERAFERLQSCPWIAAAPARCAIELYGSVKFRRMYCQVACCNEGINAYSSAHYIVTHAINKWILRSRFGKLHVRISNSSQCRAQQKPVVKKI